MSKTKSGSKTTTTYIVLKPGLDRAANGLKAKTIELQVKPGDEIELTADQAAGLVGKVRNKADHEKEASGAGAQLDAMAKELKDAFKALDAATVAKLAAEKDLSEMQVTFKELTTERDTLAGEVKKLSAVPNPPGQS
jgi:predicted house-cleaning NTP pyrophosphatase (Maf/HAM1 superfamily)